MSRYRVCGGCGRTVLAGFNTCAACAPLPGRAGRSPSTRAQRGDGGEYERNRRVVLRLDAKGQPLPGERPLCHWCLKVGRVRVATTADHVVPVSRGGSNRLENLVPACAPCNLSRSDNPDWSPT